MVYLHPLHYSNLGRKLSILLLCVALCLDCPAGIEQMSLASPLDNRRLRPLYHLGARVERGPSWDAMGFDDQDGGPGGVGIVTGHHLLSEGIIQVRWERTKKIQWYYLAWRNRVDVCPSGKTCVYALYLSLCVCVCVFTCVYSCPHVHRSTYQCISATRSMIEPNPAS